MLFFFFFYLLLHEALDENQLLEVAQPVVPGGVPGALVFPGPAGWPWGLLGAVALPALWVDGCLQAAWAAEARGEAIV